MAAIVSLTPAERKKWLTWAIVVALWTIAYNVIEGILCTWLGWEDESLSLFGFGIDSFIEVISGVGIFHLVVRLYREGDEKRDQFERTALRITGTAFYLLTLGLVVTAIHHLIIKHQPETTFWGMVFSAVSMTMMWAMIRAKEYLGGILQSRALLADAACSRVCIYMSVLLWVSSGLFAIWPLPYIDSIGTLGLAFLSFREGKECFSKAKGEGHCGCDTAGCG